jgi:mRNA interferase MazF
MARILSGEIRWADLNPIRGREQPGLRPVLIVSQNVFNERSGTVIAVALTSQPHAREMETNVVEQLFFMRSS